jgi:hypothetical protein
LSAEGQINWRGDWRCSGYGGGHSLWSRGPGKEEGQMKERLPEAHAFSRIFSRRGFLTAGGAGLAGVLLGAAGAEVYKGEGGRSAPATSPSTTSAQPSPELGGDWRAVRDQFELRRDRIHMAGFLLASHPRPVRDAIETHRQGLDEDPAE